MPELILELAEIIKNWLHGTFLEFLIPYIKAILLGLIIIIIPLTYKLVKWVILYMGRRQSYSDKLFPFFTREEVKSATKHYIQSRCQNNPPNNELEPIDNFGFAITKKLLPFIYRELFRSSSDANKYTIILADTGMGKTTFLINLVKKYYYRPWKKKLQIALFPLGTPFTNERLRQISASEASQTVLLLDALDEDTKAVEDYERRIEDLLQLTYHFKKIIISCRTQFFPSEAQEPLETKIEMFGSNRGSYKFRKIYLSPFTESDVKLYLFKKFGPFRLGRLIKAYKLVSQLQFLMVRPFLLSYIDEIVHINKGVEYSYKIYEFLVAKWIEREASKIEFNRKEEFKKELYNFSINLAINLYQNQKRRSGLFISIPDINEFAETNNIKLSELELRGRSLLNRNRENYKFAHKSILEYFISLELFKNRLFLNTFQFEGMDQARVFFLQQCADKEFAAKITTTAASIDKEKTFLLDILFSKFKVDYGSIRSLSDLASLKEYTLLNPDDFDELFFEGMLFVQHINLLITSENSIKFLTKAPALKSITILNKNIAFKKALEELSVNERFEFIDTLRYEISRSIEFIKLPVRVKEFSNVFSTDMYSGTINYIKEMLDDCFSYSYNDIIKTLTSQGFEIKEILYDPANSATTVTEFMDLIREYITKKISMRN